MTLLSDVLALPTGARFFRADLHIHSFVASHDVKDTAMTAAIVATAAREGLAIVAITDHNEIDNIDTAIQAAQSSEILVIPGIELSTLQGHLLCYLPTLDALRRLNNSFQLLIAAFRPRVVSSRFLIA